MTDPIIKVRGLKRAFRAGEQAVTVLNDVDLDIYPGEMIAISGQSGSGKSTLMNIIGCLDRGWTGTYEFKGHDVAQMGANELAALRREHFGFVFQRYQLLADLDATQNVEVPAVYSGANPRERRVRAQSLLTRLGLGDRLGYRPSTLSGGQQQRVSVARALMNGGDVILADEPTGALDSKSGEALIALLKELHAEGHTIIIVTHDLSLAAHAQRIVELKDGEIVSEHRGDTAPAMSSGPAVGAVADGIGRIGLLGSFLQSSVEALRSALRGMRMHPLRTFLTMLGIIIGVSSVVAVVALAQGTQQSVLDTISAMGTNTIIVYPGSSQADRRSVQTLAIGDATAIAARALADSVTPQVSSNNTVRYRNVSGNGSISGVGEQYFRVNNRTLVSGISFDAESVKRRGQDAVIDERARDTLFPNDPDPLGKVILLANVPVRVIGVIENASSFGPGGNMLNVWVPYTTAMTRLLGQTYLASITVRVADTAGMDAAQAEIEGLLLARHGTRDFSLQNTATIRETIESTTTMLALLISAIAVISLVVGGIGVMNIMLVSVTERTREIGVRMAVGARRSDILRQFLTESVLVCLVGGVIGVAIAIGGGSIVDGLIDAIQLSFSVETVALAFASATLIGVVFGYMPARSASRLDPIEALARE